MEIELSVKVLFQTNKLILVFSTLITRGNFFTQRLLQGIFIGYTNLLHIKLFDIIVR